MTAYGADPEQLRSLARQLEHAAQQLRDLGRTTSTSLRSSSWKGPDADSARQDWDGPQMGKVTAAAQTVETAAKALVKNAEEQDRTSSVAGSGALGGGSPGGGGGPTGIPGQPPPFFPTPFAPGSGNGGGGDDNPFGDLLNSGPHGGDSKDGHLGGADTHAGYGYQVSPTGAIIHGDASISGTLDGDAGTLTADLGAQGQALAGLTGSYNNAHDFNLTGGAEASASVDATATYTDPTGHVSATVQDQASAIAGGHVTVHSQDGGYQASGGGGLEATATVGASGTVHAGAFSLTGGVSGGVGVGGSGSGGVSFTSQDVGFDFNGNIGLLGDLGTNFGFHVNPTQLAGQLSHAYDSTISTFTPVAHALGDAGGAVADFGGDVLDGAGDAAKSVYTLGGLIG